MYKPDRKLKVEVFPKGIAKEKHFLKYYTYNRGNQMLISSSKENLIKQFIALLKDYPDADPKTYWVGHIIDPPHNLMKALDEESIKRDYDFFEDYVIGNLKDFKRLYGFFPAGVEHCTIYNPKDKEDFDDEYRKRYHSFCLTCDGNFILKIDGKTIKELYNERITNCNS